MEQLGDYLVRRLIGEGGMGKVYEAEERLSKRRVALKVLHQELSRSEQGRRLFLNEMQILAHLEHPNIVRSLASTEVAGELVMVLEYLDGRTLRSLLNAEERLPCADAVAVVVSIASALAAAHGREPPIIHRDLKPENIMVLTDGTVKVMDFGIAKVIEALNQTNTQSVGTLQYMSPEQIDAHTIDHRSDLYCLGLIFYEMLAGRPPFHSSSPRQLLNLQCTAEPPPFDEEIRRSVPKGVEQLVFQLLEKAPEDRPYLAQDVVERLEPFQSSGGISLRGTAIAAGRPSAAKAVTPHRSPSPRVSGAGPMAPPRESRNEVPGSAMPARSFDQPEASRVSDAGRGAPAADRRSGEAGPPRNDTIALVEQVEKSRNIPTGVAVAVILVLSVIAGIGAYFIRAGSIPAEQPAAGSTAATTLPPAPLATPWNTGRQGR
jgi:eukaryotic-like serine/threonine-protein kinase